MPAIGKNDTVILENSEGGKVVDVIRTAEIEVFKIMRANHGDIIYVEASKVRLLKQCAVNFAFAFSLEILNFVLYTLNIGNTPDIL
jgi:hypothetical protein